MIFYGLVQEYHTNLSGNNMIFYGLVQRWQHRLFYAIVLVEKNVFFEKNSFFSNFSNFFKKKSFRGRNTDFSNNQFLVLNKYTC